MDHHPSWLLASKRLTPGGLALFIAEIAEALAEAGQRVLVVTPDLSPIEPSRHALEEAGVRLEPLPRMGPVSLLRLAREFRANAVKLCTGGFCPDTELAFRLSTMRLPLVESLHALPYEPSVSLRRRLYYRLRSHRRYRCVVFSDAMRSAVEERIPVIRPVLRRLPFGMKLPETVARPPRPVRSFVTVTRLEESVKDVETLLRAFARLVEFVAGDRAPTLHVLGDGSSRPFLERMARESMPEGRVVFHGWVDDWTRGAGAYDVFVLSTRTESFGRVNVEAAATGLPVIASDVPGCRISVDDGTSGLLVEPGDPDALCGAMRRIIADGVLRERLAAEAPRFAQRFHPRRLVEGLRATLGEIES